MVQTKRDYALSEAKWLSEAPADWRPFRLKEAAKVSPSFSGNGPDVKDDCSVIPMEVVTEKGDFIDYDVQSYDLVTPGLTNFENGDVIFAKITPCMENGKGAFVEGLKTKYAFGSTEFHVFRPNRLIDGKFLYYYTYDPEYRKYAAENMTGAAGQKRVSTRFVEYASVFLPVISEQQLISAYLDKQCAAIDKVLESKREQLTVLEDLRKSIIHKAVTKGLDDSVEMKNSGIEWIGKVPKKWHVKRLKRICSRIQTGTTPPTSNTEYYIDGTIPWFSPGCYNGEILLNEPSKLINELALKDNNLRLFPKNTIFVVGIGATIGKVALVQNEASSNQQIIGVVCENYVYSKYFAYLMKIYESIIPNIAQYTTLPIMDQAKMGYLWIVVPSYEEQTKIVEFLDKEIKGIFSLMGNIKQQIDVLEGYRKSLIHECVTGKRRVSENDLKELANV